MNKKKILWVGDAGCPSGYANATHHILDEIYPHYDITVLGINHRGDPYDYPYPLYVAGTEGDGGGVKRFAWMCDLVTRTRQEGAKRVEVPESEWSVPDVIVLQNDPWNIPAYMYVLKELKDYAKVPVIGHIAIDGKNAGGQWLKNLAHCVFWTKFAAAEAAIGGYTGPATVIPLGVDLELFQPVNRAAARERMLRMPPDDKVPEPLVNGFIVGNVNRNQPRKRWDLTVKYFAEWVKQRAIPDAFLYLHTAPTNDRGVGILQLARYYGIMNRVLLNEPPAFYGVSLSSLVDTYNCFDVQVSTTQGEGFGLTTFEGMACGIPQIVPDWSALGELLPGAAALIPCSATAIGEPYIYNIIGGVADEAQFINMLDAMYRDPELRKKVAQDGMRRVEERRFRWENIGAQWNDLLRRVTT